MHDFRRIRAWELAHSLTLEIYRATAAFPVDERFGLVAQMRRAASSIPMNIAEGAGRESKAEFAHFVSISVGSASELLYQLRLSSDLGYLSAADGASLTKQALEVRRVADRFAASLRV